MNNIVIMGGDPFPNITPSEVKNYFCEMQTERDLADAFAIASNKFFWIEDSVYDYEEGSAEYIEACTIVDEWCALMDEYEEKILHILRVEGITIPQTGRIYVYKLFMERNGYIDGNGWWIKKD